MEYYLEYNDVKASKFWQLKQESNELTITFGKVGAAGTTQQKTCASAEAAQKEAEKQANAKIKKGYAAVDITAPRPDPEELKKRLRQMQALIEKIEVYKNDLTSETLAYYGNALRECLGDVENEAGLCAMVQKMPQLQTMLLAVFEAILEAGQRYDYLWEEGGMQAGQTIAGKLAVASLPGVAQLNAFVNSCDLDHAVDLDEAITAAWNKWGLCPEVCDLVLNYGAKSQYGADYYSEVLNKQDPPLSALVKDEKNADMILMGIGRLLRNDSDYFEDQDDANSVVTGVFTNAFDMAEDDAEEAADTLFDLMDEGKTLKWASLAKKGPTQPKGDGEQLLAMVLGALDEAAQEAWEDLVKQRTHYYDDLTVQPPCLADMLKISLWGRKHNEFRYEPDSYRMGIGAHWAERKFDVNFAGVGNDFWENRLLPEIMAWLQDKVDNRTYGDLYGGWVKVQIQLSGLPYYTGWVENPTMQAEWMAYFEECLRSRAFMKWTYKDLGCGLNYWSIFDMAEQLPTDIVLDFLHKDFDYIVDDAPYKKDYYVQKYIKRMLARQNMSEAEAKDFLQILDKAKPRMGAPEYYQKAAEQVKERWGVVLEK